MYKCPSGNLFYTFASSEIFSEAIRPGCHVNTRYYVMMRTSGKSIRAARAMSDASGDVLAEQRWDEKGATYEALLSTLVEWAHLAAIAW
jgi:hypothetical protein